MAPFKIGHIRGHKLLVVSEADVPVNVLEIPPMYPSLGVVVYLADTKDII